MSVNRTLYDIQTEIDTLDYELKKIAESDPDRTSERGREIVVKIRALEAEWRILRDATPRNYEGL